MNNNIEAFGTVVYEVVDLMTLSIAGFRIEKGANILFPRFGETEKSRKIKRECKF
jgi:hypothetical protein